MGVGKDFKLFCDNLTVNNRSDISYRYAEITQRLNTDFWLSNSRTNHSLYVGSYGRGTARRGFSDLDMIFILPPDLYKRYNNNYTYNGQSVLLQAVKNSIKNRYPRTDVRGDGQVVVVPFSDGMRFEVVPAFENTDASFTYPDANGGGKWKITNPRPEIASIKNNNILTKGNLVNLCRMTRAWKKYRNVPIGGLLIDTLACKFLMNWGDQEKSYYYYDRMVRDFFECLANQNPQQEYWRAVGSKQFIRRKGLFEYKAKVCLNISLEAIEYKSKQMIGSANKKWREIYGTTFPV
jgi:hypothetical protein